MLINKYRFCFYTILELGAQYRVTLVTRFNNCHDFSIGIIIFNNNINYWFNNNLNNKVENKIKLSCFSKLINIEDISKVIG